MLIAWSFPENVLASTVKAILSVAPVYCRPLTYPGRQNSEAAVQLMLASTVYAETVWYNILQKFSRLEVIILHYIFCFAFIYILECLMEKLLGKRQFYGRVHRSSVNKTLLMGSYNIEKKSRRVIRICKKGRKIIMRKRKEKKKIEEGN